VRWLCWPGNWWRRWKPGEGTRLSHKTEPELELVVRSSQPFLDTRWSSDRVVSTSALHARPIPPPTAASLALGQEATALASSLEHPSPTQENETQWASATPSFSEEAELRKVVSGLETKVMALQEHLAQLTLELLRERSELMNAA
jgi:hypothetical protein